MDYLLVFTRPDIGRYKLTNKATGQVYTIDKSRSGFSAKRDETQIGKPVADLEKCVALCLSTK